MMGIRNVSWLGLVLALAMIATPALAAVPGTAMIDGVLTSSGGSPAADGDYDITFAVYDAATAGTLAWTETAKVKLTGGRFQHALGSVSPLDAAKLAGLAKQWLSVKVGADPELPRQALHSTIFAMVAGEAAKLSCDGCVGANQIANGGIAAAKIGFNYAGSSTKGGPAIELECTACVSVAEMKFDGDVDLAGNSIKAKNGTFSGDVAAATVTATSFVGDGSKLTGIKTASGECKTAGEVVKGINADGSLKCVAALDPSALPKDGLNEISNDQISNQFVDTIQGAAGTAIPDNTGADANATLDFPDIGVAQTFELSVDVANTDLSKVAMVVLPPDDKKTGWTLCDPCGKTDEKAYKVTFNKDNLPKSGDLKAWIGANAKGTWNLKVTDTGYCVPQAPGNDVLCNTTNKTDGSIVAWNIKIQTLSNQKVKFAGDVYVDGKIWGKDNGHGVAGGPLAIGNGVSGLKLGDEKATCDASIQGTLRWTPVAGLEVCSGADWIAARAVPPVWIGGCKDHGKTGGWVQYCANRVDLNTLDKYMTINANGTFTAKIPGVYRFYIWAINNSGNWGHVQIVVNGTYRWYGHEYTAGSWDDVHANLMWPLKKGDTIYAQLYSSSSSYYNYHLDNGQGAHSKLQVEYLGPLAQ